MEVEYNIKSWINYMTYIKIFLVFVLPLHTTSSKEMFFYPSKYFSFIYKII